MHKDREANANAQRSAKRGIGRRQLLASAAGASLLPLFAPARARAQVLSGQAKRRTLIRGGHVCTMDRDIGNLPEADVLIEGGKIAQIAPGIAVDEASVVDASNQLVLPGLIDTHRHTWESAARGIIMGSGDMPYFGWYLEQVGPRMRPEDVYIGNLLGSLSALEGGITTLLDWSHISQTAEHSDAAILGLRESGIRGIYAHGAPMPMSRWWNNSDERHPADIARVRAQYFSSDDQLLTMAMAARGPAWTTMGATIDDLNLARDLGLRISIHILGNTPGWNFDPVTNMHRAGLLGPDITYVHAFGCSDDELQMMGDTGGSISSAAAGALNNPRERLPSVSRWARHGLTPSLGIDNEATLGRDMFQQMRGILAVERLMVSRGEPDAKIPSAEDIVRFATIEGARTTGLEQKTGSLTPGKQADIIVVDLGGLRSMPAVEPLVSFVSYGDPSLVRWVFVDGEVRKRDGQMVSINLERIRRLATESYEYAAQSTG